ncbi:MAG: PRC-barrel domain-containing protein [Aggregatilineales bacterium]
MNMHTKTKFATLSASTINGTDVVNSAGENLGNIEDIMIDFNAGRIAYAVLSFGGFLGLGEKYFAVPMEAMMLDTENERVIFDVDKDRLKNAPGFNKDNWPQTPNQEWYDTVYSYYDIVPYWRS